MSGAFPLSRQRHCSLSDATFYAVAEVAEAPKFGLAEFGGFPAFLLRRRSRCASAAMTQPLNKGEKAMTKNSKPTHRAHIVRNYTDKDGTERSHWTDIGSVWPHGDGKGYDVTLVAFPLDGRLVLRVDEPKPVQQPAEPVA